MSRVFASLSLAFLSLCFGAQLSADPPSKDKDDPATKVQSKLDIFSELTGGKGGSLGAIGALLSIGGAHPWWSLAIFALCIYVVHGIVVYGEDERAAGV